MSEAAQPTPTLDNPEQTRKKLNDWLSKTLGQDLNIPSLDIPEGTGMSNITLLFNAEFPNTDEDSFETRSYVARIQPQGDCLAFPHYDLGLQCRVMKLIAEHSAVPVPRIIAEELSGDILGQPFYIMEKTEGLIPPDIPPYHMDGWITEQSPAVRKQLWNTGIEAMADIHTLNIPSSQLTQILSQHDLPKDLNEQLTYWEDFYRWGYQSHENEKSFLTHDTVEKILPWLREHQPSEQVTSLCWGDARMANVIFNSENNAVAALLDWEMVCLGDPLQDLAWWIYMDELFSHGLDFPPLDGFPSREESVKYWCAKTGLQDSDLHYYLVFAGLRFALIMGRMSIGMNNQDNINSHFNSCFEVKYLQKIFSERDTQINK